MSMNLYCPEIELYQTPTHITYICLMSHKGVKGEVKDKAAKRGLLIYCEWLKSTLPKVIEEKDKENYEFNRNRINNHIQKIKEVIKRGNPSIFIM